MGCDKEEKSGKLSAGYGYGYGKTDFIGPELTFGIYMQEFVNEPILIFKTAWGGKSLCVNFRPPSAGPYQVGKETREDRLKRGDDVAKIEEQRREVSGHYYRLMMGHVKKVLGNIKRVYPGYDPKQGYEVAGFVWFQGCQDFGDKTTYPNVGKPGGYDEYSRLLACLIRDVRRELNVPEMRAVIGVMGINGSLEGERPRNIDPKLVPWLSEFPKAMAAPASLPGFKGNVVAVMTLKRYRGEKRRQMEARFKAEIYTDDELEMMKTAISNAPYHYMGSAKVFAGIGKGFAEAMAGVPVKGVACAEPTDVKLALPPGEQFVFARNYYMYKDGNNRVIVPPKVAPGKPWVWRARFFASPYFDIAMLEKGYHVVYCNVADLLGNPIDNLKPLADAKIPIIHVVGDKDQAVPVAENTAIAQRRYKEMGGIFVVIHKENGRHHPHSLQDPTPIVKFIEEHVDNKQR